MVLVNLSKLIQFIGLISQTPKDVWKRYEKLTKAYSNLKQTSNDDVSIKMSSNIERFRETHLDKEEHGRKLDILRSIIDSYTSSGLQIPESVDSPIYLIPSPMACLNTTCNSAELSLCRNRSEEFVNIFTTNGIQRGEVYRKQCLCCGSIYSLNYFETKGTSEDITRSYYNSDDQQYFATTKETFYEIKLLGDYSK